MRTSPAEPTSGHLQRLLASPALRGLKVLEMDGERYELAGYYPPMVDDAGWALLQDALAGRARGPVRPGGIPSVLTGYGVTMCGYCGAPLKAQTMANKRRPDGTLSDGHRRLQCTRANAGQRCSVPGSCSAAPIERAIIGWCGDLLNLRSLLGDQGAAVRAAAAQAHAVRDKLAAQLERITDAMMDSTAPPASFAARAREIEARMLDAARAVADADAAMAAAGRATVDGADERWRAVARGVDALNSDARMAARQLIADTFERIAVYHSGLRQRGGIDLVLVARGGLSRLLRIAPGGAVTAEDVRPG
jgi:hypothetical protein